jgi:hypothetical protein
VEEIKQIDNLPFLEIAGIFSHFATADAEDKTFSKQQAKRFRKLTDAIEQAGVKLPMKMIANSAAIMEIPEVWFDAVRPGIILYGQYPSDEVDRAQLDIKPVMSVKANIIKTTDGLFVDLADEIGKEYPEVKHDVWFIDITTAKLIDPARRADFKVFVLPNLYGDIITDEAAQIQGGVGTAGSANIGKRYAMFEAIHGSAPRMVTEGRAQYADPCSMIKAVAMMMEHIGEAEKSKKLNMALDVCVQFEKKLVMTGRDTGATGDEFA